MGINYKGFRRLLRKQCLWVSLSNPSLAPGLQGPLVNGVWSNLAPRVWRTFFLHQTLRKATNCVVWQRFTRIQTQPMVRFSLDKYMKISAYEIQVRSTLFSIWCTKLRYNKALANFPTAHYSDKTVTTPKSQILNIQKPKKSSACKILQAISLIIIIGIIYHCALENSMLEKGP